MTCMSLFFLSNTYAQKFRKLDVSPMDASSFPGTYKISDKTVKIIYSRPQLKGRVLNELVPEGKVWRTGANEATEITFYNDVTFGGKQIKAGTYSLFTIPGKKEWEIIINTSLNASGSSEYSEKTDVLRIKAPVSKTKAFVEVFSIVFEGESNAFTMYLAWGDTLLTIPITT